MASEHPSSSDPAHRPQNLSPEEEAPRYASDAPQSPGNESGDPFGSREGSPGQRTPPQSNAGARDAPQAPNPVLTTPSGMERGLGGYPAASGTRDLSPRDTTSQGLGAGRPLPAPVQGSRPISDPFTVSREGSPGGQNRPNQNIPSDHRVQSDAPAAEGFRERLLDVAGDYIDYNVPGRQGAPRQASNQGFAARAVEVAGDYAQQRLGSDQQGPASRPGLGSRGDTYASTSAGESYGARLMHVAGDYIGQNYGSNHPQQGQQNLPPIQTRPGYNRGDTHDTLGRRLVHIAGDYVDQNYVASNQHDHRSNSQHGSPSSAERIIDRPDTQPRPNRGDTHPSTNEGFGARLLHAAGDYIPTNFASIQQSLPALPGRLLHAAEDHGVRRQRTMETRRSGAPQSVIDHIVPVEIVDEKYPFGSVNARIDATLKGAKAERDKYAAKAKFTGLALNVAIGLQVLLGSLTTGLSAVATTGKSAAVQTTILGGLATIVASYLARARGSNEPELSITRVKDLEQFIREVDNFKTDHGDEMGNTYDSQMDTYRHRFEELLGNANGERKLSSVISSAQSYGGNNNNSNSNNNRT